MSLNSESKLSNRIPISQPCLGDLELEYVTEAVKSTWIGSTGFFIEKMKEEFAHEIGVVHAIPVSNGTVALHLALLAVGIEEGDEVIVPSLTYIAPVNAVMYCGGIPIFADVQEDSWCISADDILKLITSKTKAIIVVHLYGMPANMNEIMKIAQAHNIRVIEDAAEAMFAKYGNSFVGCIGDIATFSLFGNKVLSSGEGGILTTNDKNLAHKVELLKGQGMDANRRYWFPVIGFNYRMTNVAAAIFCAQFAKRESLLERRWKVYSIYDEFFTDVNGITIQVDVQGVTRSPWLYPILLNEVTRERKDKIMAILDSKGIETRPFFIPVHTMPPYATVIPRIGLEKTEKLSRIGLNLPTFPDLQVDQAAWIADTVLNVVNETR
jgi:perosamine synthetase